MLFDNTDFDYELSLFKIPGSDFSNTTKNAQFLEPLEAFIRGNSEKNTYVPYKKYTYLKLKPENEKEDLMLKLMAYSFIINDLNLYLDLNPNDMITFEKFKKYINEYNKLEMDIANKYGPLCLKETTKNNYDWLKNPWPWDKMGGSYYV